jgi:hypothetical protein
MIPASLGISGNRFRWLSHYLWEGSPGWTRGRAKRFVLDHYEEAVSLCRLTGKEPFRKAILAELLALSKEDR